MSRFFVALLLLTLGSSAMAQTGSTWSYHGLPNGPSIRPLAPNEISGTPFFLAKNCCPPTVMVYEPPHITLTEAPQPRKLILGWHKYYSPSPRPVTSVSVKP